MNNKDGEGELRAPLPEPLWHVRLKMRFSFVILRMPCGEIVFLLVIFFVRRKYYYTMISII